MVDMANHEQAVKCTEIARAALEANNLEKARRFADKAMKLHASDEVSSSALWRHMCIILACWQAQGLALLPGVAAVCGTGSCIAAKHQGDCVLNDITFISINFKIKECRAWLLLLPRLSWSSSSQLRLLVSQRSRGRQAVEIAG